MSASHLMILKDGVWTPWDGVMTVASSGTQSKDEKQEPKKAVIARPQEEEVMSAAHIMIMVDGEYVPWDGTTTSVGEGGTGGLDQATADTLYVNVAGDTVGGDLTVTGLLLVDSAYTAAMALDRGAPTQYCQFEFRTAGVQKWTAGLRANELDRWTLYNAVTDIRALDIDGTTALVKVAGDPTDDLGVATKQYVDDVVTVSTADPSGVPARDGLLWVKVAP